MNDPLDVFLLIFAFITSGILLSQFGHIAYDIWKTWKEDNGPR
jgi:hypothetical protein